MSKTYKTKVNGTSDHQFTKAEIDKLDADEFAPNTYHILRDNQSVHAEISKSDFLNRRYTVRVNSNNYEVAIANELDLLIEEMGLELKSAQQVNELYAPMPGVILEINVSEGDEVKEGDQVLVLEAMKMENTLTAPRDGNIKSIAVKKTDTVGKNELLVEME